MWAILDRKDGFQKRIWIANKFTPNIRMREYVDNKRNYSYDDKFDDTFSSVTKEIRFDFKEWLGDIAVYEES